MNIIVKGKPGSFGKTRSEHERNLRKEWGSTMSDGQLDKLKYIERKMGETLGSKKNFVRGHDIDKVK
jgi:hypothetical protein